MACIWKSLFCMKSCNLISYWCVGSITTVLPLSAFVIIASCSLSFVCSECTSFASGCVLWVGFCFCNLSTRSATIFLYASLSLVGSCVMAVSASRARVWIQTFFLA